jgi:hypothetical protein
VVLAFGDHRLDIKRRELRRGTELIDLEPKVFDLLAFLVQHRDRVVSKDDLLQEVWGGRIVSESALTTRTTRARARARVEAGNQRPWPADKVERWAIDRLIPYAKNARTHTDAQVAAIAFNPRSFGACFSQPETACHLLTTRGPSCTMDSGSSTIE